MVARVMTPSKEEHMTDVVEVMRAMRNAIGDDLMAQYSGSDCDEAKELIEILDTDRLTRAALAALNEAGYVVGPLNATLEMCRAGHQSDLLGCDIPDDECEMYYSRVYAAMLSAAQPAPK